MKVLEGKYEVQKDFLEKIKGLEQEPETGARCKVCYALRMEEAARKAKEEGYDYFTTVLSISPMKDRKSTRLNSSHANISYAVFCLKKKQTTYTLSHSIY